MTVSELVKVLSALPEDFDNAPVWWRGEDDMTAVRAVCVIPSDPADPFSPRVELMPGFVSTVASGDDAPRRPGNS